MLKINTNFKKVRIPLVLGVLGLSGIFLFQYLTFIPEYSSAESISTVNPNKTLMDITYMQEMTPAICERSIESTSSTGDTYQKQLIDIRDNKTYWVAKLKDGNCWMTQNLDYDIMSEGITGDELAKTDLADDWTPASAYPPTATTTSPFTNSGNNLALSYDPGERFCGENGNCSNDPNNDKHATSGENGHDAYGNYYTYVAATAGTGGGKSSGSASGSVCPRGWQLPISGNDNKSFGKLMSGLTGNILASKNGPYFYVYSGNINGYLNSTGNNGYYWSATTSNSSVAYHLYFNYSRVSPSDIGDYRSFGYTVRCVNSDTNNNDPIKIGIDNPNLSVTVDKILTMKLDSNEVNIEPKNGEIMTGDFGATVSSNADYTLSITAAEGASTSLVNQNDNIVIAEIPTIANETSSLTPNENNWAIRLCHDTNKTNCNNYKPITPYGTTNIFLTNGTPTPSTTSLFEVGIGISPSLPSGTYSTNILVTASQK